MVYESMRSRLTIFFQSKQCMYADDLVDTVLDRVAIKIETVEVENMSAYIFGVAKNVYREYVRKVPLMNEIDEAQLSAAPTPPDMFEVERVRLKLDGCLDEMKETDRDLLIEYMSARGSEKKKSHQEITKRLSTTATALRMKIVRLKRQLKQCLQECLAP